MFSTGSLDKNSSTLAESHSPGRSKFPVGLNPLGDETQQNNRIQSAVHRYNNSAVGSFARSFNERGIPSPFRQAFLKNSQKFKNFDGDKDEAQSISKKSYNYYQGVGNFPIVHLKKNEMITRPIRRVMNNGFKIQLPELPFNRFLNHSPDVCLDTKSSTRSVLDVLQDLSRKRIHTKDDNEVTKRKCKGLGGDAPLDIEAPYKPLFVTKTKTTSVSLRDSTTQTQDPQPVELSPSKKNDTAVNNKKDDPKAELRRKLARQNNEISASLSSSTLMYPLKRNSGKISQDENSSKQKELNSKTVKYFFEEKNDKKLQNGDASKKDSQTANTGDVNASKSEKKHKTVESKLSPNKDRLTTIFLEMQNVNPIVEVLTNQTATETSDKQSKTLTLGKPSEEKNTSYNKTACTESAESSTKNNITTSVATSPSDNKKSDDNVPNFFTNNTDNKQASTGDKSSFTPNVLTTVSFGKSSTISFGASTTATLNFGASSTSPTFKLPVASTVSSSLTQMPILSTGVSQKTDNTTTGSTEVSKSPESVKSDTGVVTSIANSPKLFLPPASGSGFSLTPSESHQSTTGGMFKFGVNTSTTLPTQSPTQTETQAIASEEKPENTKEKTVLDVPVTSSQPLTGFTTSISGTIGQSSLLTSTVATTSSTSTSQPQQNPPGFTFSDKIPTATTQAADKPMFQFGFNPPTTSSSSNSMPTLFGAAPAKPEEKPATEQVPASKPETTSATTFPPSSFPNSAFSASTFGQPAVTSAQSVMPFKFGEKTEPEKPSSENPTTSTTNFFDQKKPSLFTFGQKPEAPLNTTSSAAPASQPSIFQQSTFTFGQKMPASTTAQTSTSSSLFGQTTTPQPSLFQQPATSTSNPIMQSTSSPFGATSQPSDTLNKPQVPSFMPTTSATTGLMNTFTENKLNPPAFGQVTPSFGQPSTSAFSADKPIFGATTSQAASAFGAPTPQPTPFSQAFGDANKQHTATNQTSNFFSQPAATQTTTFPTNTGFGTTAFGQAPSADNIFGQKSGFKQNQNQSTPFDRTPTSQPFSTPSGFSFGASAATSTSTGFTMSNPSTTSSVFGFGGAPKPTMASSSTFGFGGTSQPETTSAQSIFTFNNQPQASTFKFGNSTGNAATGSSTFSFNSTPSTSEAAKPSGSVFSFGTPQTTTSANAGFNFGGSQTPVFSFGSGSGSSAGSSKFSFGTTPTPGGIFTPGATPSPSTVPLQGVFSIGSGSSQPRNRSSAARARRRT